MALTNDKIMLYNKDERAHAQHLEENDIILKA